MLSRRQLLSLGGSALAGGAFAWVGLDAPVANAASTTVNGHRISGRIYSMWKSNKSVAGLPIAGAKSIAGGSVQTFQRAWIYSSSSGSSLIRGELLNAFVKAGGSNALGIPIGVEAKNPYYLTLSQRCTTGRIWWSRTEGYKAVPNSQTVRLRGVRNFRDAAGTDLGVQVKGGRMRRGLVYRSNRLHDLTDLDAAILQDLSIRTIIDLRTPGAIKSSPDRTVPGIGTKRIDVFGGSSSSGTSMYRAFVTSSYRRARIAEAITTVANSKSPVLLHCTHGRDRTGWIIAMIQFALGASEQTVFNEWLKSNQYLGNSGLKTSYLKAGLAEVKARYGSVEGYLSKGLGLSSKTRSALRARLVA